MTERTAKLSKTQKGANSDDDMTTLGLYTVAVYDHRKYMVGMAEDVVAWTAREAYFNVMNDMPSHETYYVRRTADLEERESSDG